MQAFIQDSRVQRTDAGIFFYEQDILYSSYLFQNSITVNMKARFEEPGLGLVIAEDNERDFRDASHLYLLDLGPNEFRVYEKHNVTQSSVLLSSTILAPERGKEVSLIFEMTGKDIAAYFIYDNPDTKKEEKQKLGTFRFTRKFSGYRIGIYSNKGNTIEDISFQQGIPENWQVNANNTRGGYISFFRDGFRFEKCLHDAEVEQDNITLPAGTYYLKYNTDAVDKKMDIKAYLFPSNPKAGGRKKIKDDQMEDAKKSILTKDGIADIEEEGTYSLKFVGTSGKVTNIALMDNEKSDFVETREEIVADAGSSIVILTDGVKEVHWEGVIFDVPLWKNLREECPYAILATDIQRLNLDTFSLVKGERYKYVYDADQHLLTATSVSDPSKVTTHEVDFGKVISKFTIFENMKAAIYNLELFYTSGMEVNINIQKTFRVFVPASISGPVIVADDKGNSFDLSSAYREVVDPTWRIDLFAASKKEIALSYHMTDVMAKPEVYGIPEGRSVNPDTLTIQELSRIGTKLDEANFTVKDHKVSIPSGIRNHFAYVAVYYQSSENYLYHFTNYEREYFTDEKYIVLEHAPSMTDESIYVYGIPTESSFYKDYLYRIPNKDMMNSIDLCADTYDVIPSSMYFVNETTHEITLNKSLMGKYSCFVIDYLKQNSYSINYDEESGQYLVDISSESNTMHIHYEMDDKTGESSNIRRTSIVPDKNKFIVLKRDEGAFYHEN